MEVQKGKIHSLESGGKAARCIPDNDAGIVTRPLVIPFYWRATMGNIQVGESVYFLEDESRGGFILGRCDGEWDNTLRGSMKIEESLTVAQDVTASGKSLVNHTHTDSRGGGTSPPL